MSDLGSLLRPPGIYLILAIVSFSGAVVSTCTGKTWGRVGRSVCRAQEPSNFWWVVAIYYLSAVLFMGIFMYRMYGLSR